MSSFYCPISLFLQWLPNQHWGDTQWFIFGLLLWKPLVITWKNTHTIGLESRLSNTEYSESQTQNMLKWWRYKLDMIYCQIDSSNCFHCYWNQRHITFPSFSTHTHNHTLPPLGHCTGRGVEFFHRSEQRDAKRKGSVLGIVVTCKSA